MDYRCLQPLLVCTNMLLPIPLTSLVSLHHVSMWTGRRCYRGKCRRPSSRPSAAGKTSVTLTRSSPLKCPHSLRRGSLAFSAARTRKASGTLTTSQTSAEGPGGTAGGGSSMSRMFRLDSIATVVHKERKPFPLTCPLIVCLPIITL